MGPWWQHITPGEWLIAGLVLLAPLLSRAEAAAPPPADTKEARAARTPWWRRRRARESGVSIQILPV